MNKSLSIIFLFIISGCHCANPTHGKKTGVIVKIAEEGLLVPTNEAELIRGGLSGGSGVNGQAFHFNIQDPEVLNEAMRAFETGAEVEVEYERHVVDPITQRERSEDPTATKISLVHRDSAGCNTEQSMTK